MINPKESWHVDVNGEVYETNFEGLVNWIDEGSLLRLDKVRRGNLRWLEAGKIPLLYGFFNAKDMGQPMPPIQFSTTEAEIPTEIPTNPTEIQTQTAEAYPPTQNFSPNNFTVNESLPPTGHFSPPLPPTQNFMPTMPAQNQAFYQPQFEQQMPPVANVCLIHNDEEASYLCDTCLNVFCKMCPKGYGGNVKICPMCGSMCTLIKQLKQQQEQNFQLQMDLSEGFGIADFGRAMAYPFKYKVSLFFGGILFMLFTLGQSASGSGSFMMLGAVIICFMLANMLTFGILSNTIEDFSQGKIGGNYMPSFDDFSLWDDMVQPFFLSVAVYIVSFGLTIAIIAGSAWFMWSKVKAAIPKNQTAVTELKKLKDAGQVGPEGYPLWMSDNDIAKQRDLENMQKQLGTQGITSLASQADEVDANAANIVVALFKTAGIIIIPLFLSILWGLFYYPAACTVAAYTRSFSATLNPSVGLDTIKRLGVDYAKILGMMMILIVISVSIGVILNLLFAPFDLPGMGNLPANAVGSWFTFYFSIVFAVIMGYAMYKNTEKLNLFRS